MAKMDIGIEMLTELREKVDRLEKELESKCGELAMLIMLLGKATEATLESLVEPLEKDFQRKE